jgi:hypothetical protein
MDNYCGYELSCFQPAGYLALMSATQILSIQQQLTRNVGTSIGNGEDLRTQFSTIHVQKLGGA